MSLSAWKQKLANLPVLGKLVVGLRGVYTLGAWRADLRQQQSELTARLDAQEARLNGLGQELAELRSDCLNTRESRLRLTTETETLLKHAGEDQAREQRVRSARLANTMAWLVQRVDRLDEDLARARSAVGEKLVLDVLSSSKALSTPGQTDAGASSSTATRVVAHNHEEPVLAVVPQSLASLLAGSPVLQRWQHLLTVLPDPEQAQALCLDHVPVSGWIPALRGLTQEKLALLVATHGEPASAEALAELLRAANAALAPGGVLALVLPNAGNLLVAARLLQEERPVGINPSRAAELASDVGLVEVRTLLTDGSQLSLMSNPEADVPGISQLLAAPARFCLFARKVI